MEYMDCASMVMEVVRRHFGSSVQTHLASVSGDPAVHFHKMASPNGSLGGGGFDGADDSELLFSDSTSPSDVGSDLSVATGGAGRVGGTLGLFGGPGRWGGGGFDGAEESGASDSPYDRIRFNSAINVCQTWISVAQTSTVFG